MNTVTSADSSYYAANTNENTEKRPCLAMTVQLIGLKRVKCLHATSHQHNSHIAFTCIQVLIAELGSF